MRGVLEERSRGGVEGRRGGEVEREEEEGRRGGEEKRKKEGGEE